ncbi:hypothetical protein ACA910_003251 [Epithemia clementina (nom. ined.)]
MGDVWIPDRAVTVEIVLALLDLLDEDFKALQVGQRRLEVCLTGALIVAGYTAALRGEELPQIDVGMLRRYWEEGQDYVRKPHVPLTLVGGFKQTNGLLKTYVQLLAPTTSSGIQVQLWIGRSIQEYNHLGVSYGPLFRVVNGKSAQVKRATVSQLDSLFHDALKRLQHR